MRAPRVFGGDDDRGRSDQAGRDARRVHRGARHRLRDGEGHVRDPVVRRRRAEERRAHPRAREAELLSRPALPSRARRASCRFGDPQTRDMSPRTSGAAAAAARRSASPRSRRSTRTCAAPSASRIRIRIRGLRRQPVLHHEDRQPGARRQATPSSARCRRRAWRSWTRSKSRTCQERDHQVIASYDGHLNSGRPRASSTMPSSSG